VQAARGRAQNRRRGQQPGRTYERAFGTTVQSALRAMLGLLLSKFEKKNYGWPVAALLEATPTFTSRT